MSKAAKHNRKLNAFKVKKRTVPSEKVELFIDGFSEQGRGIAKHHGKVVFVDGAIVGETVSAKYTAVHKNHDEAICVNVLSPVDSRSEPRCKYFSQCGGCSLQHIDYQAQLGFKNNIIRERMLKLALFNAEKVTDVIAEPIRSPAFEYRHRARFSVKANKNQCVVGFKESKSHHTISVNKCDVLLAGISKILPDLQRLISGLKQRSQVEELLLAEDSVHSIYIQVISKRLLPETDIEILRQFSLENDIHVECYDHNTGTVYWRTSSQLPTYHYNKEGLSYQFSINDFTQVNPSVNEAMIEQACEWMNLNKSDNVADFFCGIGNFSLPIAKRVSSLIGYELERSMVIKAGNNATLNSIGNANFEAVDLFSFQLPKNAHYTKVLLDPPRAGAQVLCRQLSQSSVDIVIYISCNQSTFFRDAEVLISGGFVLSKFGAIDMFPQTEHLEIMALFSRQV